MTIGIILAAGRGTRLNSHEINKVTLPFAGKPIITYAVDLFKKVCDSTIVVVGVYAESVKSSLSGHSVQFVEQPKPLGTADAVRVGLESLDRIPNQVLVGYGDHMMFYHPSTIRKLIELHHQKKPALSLISVKSENSTLHWGIIVRDKNRNVIDSVEFKDATRKQRSINELNAGLYCFDYSFLKNTIASIEKSPVTGEYYLNALIKMAYESGSGIEVLPVSLDEVGIGVNTAEDLANSEKLFSKRS